MKLAIVLFNLGGPDSPEAVEPFLRNLFSDPAVIDLPAIVRRPLARFIAARRAPFAKAIYARLGGGSPILKETGSQAEALRQAVTAHGFETRVFIAMRCWEPLSDEAAKAAKAWGADRMVLLPLYPQYSTTTSASSIADWTRAAKVHGLDVPTARVCCFPWEPGFVATIADSIRDCLATASKGLRYRLLLSAHGLPKRIIARGDPYRWQVEQTARAIVDRLGIEGLDWQVCYQSRVGPLEWIGPATDSEIRRAGRDGAGLIVAPIAFVSEHSETLVELDIEYAQLAAECGVPDYRRIAAVGAKIDFIEGLAGLVVRAVENGPVVTCGEGRICPQQFKRCGYGTVSE